MKQRDCTLTHLLLISLLLICEYNRTLAQTEISDLKECQQTKLIRSYYNPSEYIIVCIECNIDYVVSYDLQTCIHYTDLIDSHFQYCKRLGPNAQCVEALCAIQINEKGNYVTITNANSDENCAQFDSQTKKCLYPRFNYALDLNQQTITYDAITFCAIRSDTVCVEYHSAILNFNSLQSVMLHAFVNIEEIDKGNSTITNIVCKQGYELIKLPISNLNTQNSVFDLYYGCGLINYQVEHCIAHNKYTRVCFECGEGYSLSNDGKQCVQIDNCVAHEMYQSQYLCIQPKPFHYLESGRSIALTNCAEQAKDFYCAYCNAPYYGYRCENTSDNKDLIQNCELVNRDGVCVKCKFNDDNFYHIFNNVCQQRKLSLQCLNKSYISDSCNDFNCIDNYRFNVIHYEIYYGKSMRSFESYSCSFLEKDLEIDLYAPWSSDSYTEYIEHTPTLRDVYYTKYQFNLGMYADMPFCVKRTDFIDACNIYDQCFESCESCAQGYSLVQRNDFFADYFHRFICVKNPVPGNTIIENCYQYSIDHTQCLTCEDYYMSTLTTCEKGTIQNCLAYAHANHCKQCEYNFVLYKNQCYYVELCLSYKWLKDNLYCTECIQRPDTSIALVQMSNQLRSDCVTNPPLIYCSQYIDNICIECQTGYVLLSDSKKCIPETQIEPHCSRATEQLKCTNCINGYQLISGKCFKTRGSCSLRYQCDQDKCSTQCFGLNINNTWTCNYDCPAGFGIYADYCTACSDIYGEGCDQCNDHDQCEHCKDGYFWDSQTQKCLFKCPNGQITETNKCVDCTTQSCQTCSDPTICTSCQNKLFLSANQCIDKCPDNQIAYISDAQNIGNICLQCSEGCSKCSLDNNLNIYCSLCQDGWYLLNGACTQTCPYYLDSNKTCSMICQNFIQNKTECVEACPSKYSINKTIEHQQTIMQLRVCVDSCTGYAYKDNPLECTQECQEGYFPNTQTKICEPCSLAHCSSCSKGIDTCDGCAPQYYLLNGVCNYICDDTQRLVLDQSSCSKCHIYGCQNDCSTDGQCTTCQPNFVLENKACRCPEEKGFFVEYPALCKKCGLANCQLCSTNDSCSKCQEGYNLYKTTGEDPTLGYYARYNCKLDCPDGTFAQNGECISCTGNCLSCSGLHDCYECRAGYIQIVTTAQVNGEFTTDVQCLYNCPDNTLQHSPNQCYCQDENCHKCSQNPTQCEVCITHFNLTSDHKCQFAPPTDCKVPYCQKCDSTEKYCITCVVGYLNFEGNCRFLCQSGELASVDGACPKSQVCEVSNCLDCQDYSSHSCKICQSPYLLDVYGQCIKECEITPFQNQQVCLACPFECSKCDQSGVCTSCKGTNKIEDKCLCPKNSFIYKDSCVEICPFYSTPISNTHCIEYCADGLFPYMTSNREQRMCEKVQNANSDFCTQNIENIPQLVSFRIESTTKNGKQHNLIIQVEQTPSICYNYSIQGSRNNVFPVVLLSESTEFTYYNATLIQDELDCNEAYCAATLEIQSANSIQCIISISLSTDGDYIFSNGANFLGNQPKFNAVCPTCTIPTNSILPSTTKIICPYDNVCTNTSIKTLDDHIITITQIVNDARFFTCQLQAHSLILEYIDPQSKQATISVDNYYYDNSILGQITYTFITSGLKTGNLVVTSVCNSINQKANNRILVQSQENVFYPQMNIEFDIGELHITQASNSQGNISKESQSSSDDSMSASTIVLIIVFTLIGIVSLYFLIVKLYRRYHKKQQNLIYGKHTKTLQMDPIQLGQNYSDEHNKNEIIPHQEIESQI